MGVHRLVSRGVGSLLCAASVASAGLALAQAPPNAVPGSPAAQDAAIIRPLSEIGRVRARTPYCAALAATRQGVDSAITYQFAIPTVYRDLKNFRLDSHLTKHQSLQRTERDLVALWELATAGRDEVRALRAAATAYGVDEARRAEMLGYANALDGAKARQMLLAKSLARTVAFLAEAPIRDIANNASDDRAPGSAFTGGSRSAMMRPSDAAPTFQPVTSAHAEALEDHDRQQRLFSAVGAERFIRDDLEDAARHASNAMRLGGCTSL